MYVHEGYIVLEKCFERVHADQIGALVSTDPLLFEISQKFHSLFPEKFHLGQGVIICPQF